MGATKWILAGALVLLAAAASSTSGNVNPYTGAVPREAASVGSQRHNRSC